MIANCGQLGLDWRWTSISAYMEGLEARIDAMDPKGAKAGEPKVSDIGRVRRFHEARRAKVANDG